LFANGRKEAGGHASARKVDVEEQSVSRSSHMSIDYSIGSRGQLKVDSSVEAARLSEDLLNNTIVGNALLGLSQSAAFICDQMKGFLQQHARYPLDHIKFVEAHWSDDLPFPEQVAGEVFYQNRTKNEDAGCTFLEQLRP